MPDTAITRWLRGDPKETEEGIKGRDSRKVEEGRNPRATRLLLWPISVRLAHNVSRRGRFSITLGCVGRWPGIKDSARAGGRHSGVRLEVSLGAPSL